MALPMFIEDVPTCEVRGGRMHIQCGDLALVMPIHVFLKGCQIGKDAIKDWQAEQRGMVVPIGAEAGH